MSYDVVGVRADGTTVEHRGAWSRAPKDLWLFNWGRSWHRRCDVVIRYWPSKKGWVPLDIRRATVAAPAPGASGFSKLVGAVRGPVFPSEDAAIMYAIAALSVQGEFDFARQ